MKKKVVVGMSGGVDSSVTAYLLKEQGYDVMGVTMRIWQDDNPDIVNDGGCCGITAVDDARRVAGVLDIPYYVMDFRNEFKKEVIDYFVNEYKAGRTPNPCIVCNRYLKWGHLLHKAIGLGADYIATGHYARVSKLDNGRFSIQNSITAQKDQSYALYNLTQEQLSRTLMPVGEYAKSEVREIAAKAGLPVASKRDSQDICFIPDHDYAAFIEKQLGYSFPAGKFVDIDGNVIGEHKGIIHYTIGQRKGLNISDETPWFVKGISVEDNQVILCKSDSLFEKVCYVSNVNFMGIGGLDEPVRAIGKVRYAHKGAPCIIEKYDDSTIKCTFDEPQRAMTPGQAAVFMSECALENFSEAIVLCGGIIERSSNF